MSGLTGNNILAGSSGQATGYNIERSAVLDTNSYFTRTPSSAGNRKTWTISAWVKIANLASTNPSPYNIIFSASGSSDQDVLYFESDDTLVLGLYASDPTTNMQVFKTSALFRDISAWYHIVVSCDTTAGSNYVKLYINGEEVTNFSTDNRNNAALSNHDTEFNNTYQHRIGKAPGSDYLNAYLADFNWIDGQALTPASFGETNADTNQWIAKKYAGSYGTNGFYLKFQDSSALGDDSSGNTNDFTPTNLTATDQVLDSPTNNFATVNPLVKSTNTFSEGNLKVTASTSASSKWASTIGVSSGKWYAEFITPASNFVIGITADNTERDYLGNSDGNTSIAWWPVTSGTNLFINGSNTAWAGNTTTWANGDIVGLALNADDEEISIYKNGTLISPAVSYSSYNWTQAFFAGGNYASGLVYYTNFGQDSSFAGQKTAQNNTDWNGKGDFYYTPPSGYLGLCEDNLPDPSIVLPGDYFEAVVYVGDGNSTQEVTTNFQPDFTWNKNRTTGYHHRFFDRVRGLDKSVYSNKISAEDTYQDYGYPTATSSTSVTVGQGTDTNKLINLNNQNYVMWNWKADNTSGSSNTDGTITSTVSANPTAGFSIVSYTGNATDSTVGHGLNKTPGFIIIKKRNGTSNWPVYHQSLATQEYLVLDLANAKNTSTDLFYQDPTSSVFYIGDASNAINASGGTYIAYCFAEVEGYSKFGSYTGNGSADGSFVYTGFKPAFVMIKRTDSITNGHWIMMDSERGTYNPIDTEKVYANLSNSESDLSGDNTSTDFLSNGFKLRGTYTGINGSGATYIYMALSESQFKYSNAR